MKIKFNFADEIKKTAKTTVSFIFLLLISIYFLPGVSEFLGISFVVHFIISMLLFAFFYEYLVRELEKRMFDKSLSNIQKAMEKDLSNKSYYDLYPDKVRRQPVSEFEMKKMKKSDQSIRILSNKEQKCIELEYSQINKKMDAVEKITDKCDLGSINSDLTLSSILKNLNNKSVGEDLNEEIINSDADSLVKRERRRRR